MPNIDNLSDWVDLFSNLMFGALILLFLFLFAIWLRERNRIKTLRAMAAQMGFQFFYTDTVLHQSLGHFKLFNQGHSRRAKNVFKGTHEKVSVLIADYEYITGRHKSRTTHCQTVFIIKDPEMRIPHFFLRRENKIFDFLGKAFGGQDINFSEDPQFSDAFVLQGLSEAQTRQLFDKNIRNELLKFAGSNIQVEAYGPQLVVHKGRNTRPDELIQTLEETFEIYNLFKSSPRASGK